jgi:hypothetical protein
VALQFETRDRNSCRSFQKNADILATSTSYVACFSISATHNSLAGRAFQKVFQRKQTQHRALLAWLKTSLATARISDRVEREMLDEAVKGR